jgi:transposase
MTRALARRKRSSRKGSKGRRPYRLHKPGGVLQPRVQAVGPEHFGILCCDCGKHGSKYMLADFYGKPLLEPTRVQHTRGDLQAALDRIRQALVEHDLRDFVVAIEQTGEYHRPLQRACRQLDWDVRLVHPYATSHARQPADPGNKTDDRDLAAIFRVTVNGFGLIEPSWPEVYQHLQLLRRHRRDLVKKTSKLQCQIREQLHAAMPGYAEVFGQNHFWDNRSGMFLARRTGTAEAVQQLGADGLLRLLTEARIRSPKTIVYKILAWAQDAPAAHPHAAFLHHIIARLDDDRLEKTKQINDVERQLAGLLVRTPFVLLLAIPGINIVSSADLAGELGPIWHYANPNRITGRAGLAPCRYQSENVDVQGPLRRAGNLKLRAVLTQIADTLVRHNDYYRARAKRWQLRDKDPRWIRVKVAKCFSRLAFAMLTSHQLFPHPCCQDRHYILGKLLQFHTEHGSASAQFQQDMLAVCEQLPRKLLREEAVPLRELLDKLAHKRGPQPVADILAIVLARLELRRLQSPSRAEDPNSRAPAQEPTTP